MTTHTLPSSDFYGLERTLEPSALAVLHAVRTFMRDEVEPIINDYWTRAKFPFQILDGVRQLDIAGLPYEGYGCPGHSRILDGMVFMELARTDPSIATFHGVHSGLAMGTKCPIGVVHPWYIDNARGPSCSYQKGPLSWSYVGGGGRI